MAGYEGGNRFQKKVQSFLSSAFLMLQSSMLSLPLRAKQATAFILDGILVLVTVWLACSFRFEMWHVPHGGQWLVYVIALAISLPVFYSAGLYNSVFRFSESMAIKQLIKAVTVYGVLFFLILVLLKIQGVPRSISILQPMMLFLFLLASRGGVRFLLNTRLQFGHCRAADKRLLIYGVGSAGIQLAIAIEEGAQSFLVGFIDDDPKFHGRLVKGLRVFSFEEVPGVIEKAMVTDILLAIPSAAPSRRKEILRALQPFHVHIRTLPSIEDMTGGNVSVADVKEVDIEDLLGRDPVSPDLSLIGRNIARKTVAVTGAGGSIGRELCRRVLFSGAARLLLVDHSEFNVHDAYLELDQYRKRKALSTDLVPLLCNVAEENRFGYICSEYRPQTVYHAAAYKHVPMVEQNPVEGVRNNVFGTLHAALAALEYNVENFILVSTDKAVRPANVMGASKRLCEIILQALAAEKHDTGTCFSMVRFGNVLNSSGSVIPLFHEQIREGGPVTVTHPEITRYFMTISEAVQLVVQAGAMARGGEVFVLDMGEPVKIFDLAKRLIELSGLTVGDNKAEGNIRIEFIGLRPGEKLYEELLISDNPQPTDHPRIFKAHEEFISWAELEKHLAKMEQLLRENDVAGLSELLGLLVNGYSVPRKQSRPLVSTS
ncbi:MAG: polysaccharide biosynthesis protein [Chlorobiales bacterium]|nr:polysaccharide biosynthesis protein [Chlorobiales bacterium]